MLQRDRASVDVLVLSLSVEIQARPQVLAPAVYINPPRETPTPTVSAAPHADRPTADCAPGGQMLVAERTARRPRPQAVGHAQ